MNWLHPRIRKKITLQDVRFRREYPPKVIRSVTRTTRGGQNRDRLGDDAAAISSGIYGNSGGELLLGHIGCRCGSEVGCEERIH